MATIIAEIGINHNGDVQIAKKLMDMAKRCGVGLVKFQKRTVDIVFKPAELAAPRESPWGTTNGDWKRGLEFGFHEYEEIDRYAKEIGVQWFASAWDVPSLEFLDYFKPNYQKVASAMLINCDFIEEVARRRKMTFISTGMIESLDPVDKVVAVFRYYDCPFTLMHCVGEYPCDPVNTHLQVIKTMQARFPGTAIGFSSHAVSPLIGAYSVIYGAVAVEAHITLDRSMYGSDQSASLEEPGLRKLVEYCNIAELSIGLGKKMMSDKERANAKKLRWWLNG